jgi:putative glutamine amidotransferase
MHASRPRIAILGRFADSTSVTRHGGLVTARRLAEAVWAAGAEPITLLPVANSNWAERLLGIDAVLMPGGGDVDPAAYGQTQQTAEIYGVDPLQDEVDISLYRYAVANAIPVLAICRGLQVINVAQGGTLVQDMSEPHRHHIEEIDVEDSSALGLTNANAPAGTVTGSCYHHQAVDQLGADLRVIARSAQGNVEAFELTGAKAWTAAVQWHPEDNFETEPENLAIFEKLVAEARR